MADDVSAYSTHAFLPGLRNNSWSNLFDLVPGGTRVLDVGCSTGNLGAGLIEYKNCTVIGVDLNAADIEIARHQLTDAFVLDVSAGTPSELLGTFDVIIFADVLEHLADPRATLRAIHALLNPGGLIAYSIPHMGHASVRLDLLAGDFPYTETGILDKTHFHYYDRTEIESVLRDGGFAIQDEDPVTIEYPELFLVERLASLGLTPGEEFFSMLARTEAHVFQYVGTAMPTAVVPARDGPARTRPMPTDEVLELVGRLSGEKATTEQELANLKARVAWARRHPLAYLAGEVRNRLGRRKSD